MPLRLPAPAFEQKIVSFDELARRAAALPKPVVMTNGVFDILHRGHVTYLAQARALGASLVVAVNSDASVRMLGKGDDRPINTEADRAAVLAALESVDLVVVFEDKVPLKVIEQAHPDIYVKGGDYRRLGRPHGHGAVRASAIDDGASEKSARRLTSEDEKTAQRRLL